MKLVKITTANPPVGNGLGDQGPELRRMVELADVAELVRHDVFGELARDQGNLPVEGDGAVAAATPPPSDLVANLDAADFETVVSVDLGDQFVRQVQGFRRMAAVLGRVARQVLDSGMPFEPVKLTVDPSGVVAHQALDGGERRAGRGHRHDADAGLGLETQTPHPQAGAEKNFDFLIAYLELE